MIRAHAHPDRGSVLILAVWSLFFLGALALAVGAYVSANLTIAGGVSREMTAYYLARGGVEWAIASVACDTNEWDARTEAWGDESNFRDVELEDGSFSVFYESTDGSSITTNYGLIDEESRINVNRANAPALSSLIMTAAPDINPVDAEALANSIVDWRDADNKVLTGGAESSYYEALNHAYPCHDGAFDSVHELLLVKGMDDGLFQKLRPHLTVYGSGLININTAGRTVLLALARSGNRGDEASRVSVVERLLGYRAGGGAFEGRKALAVWRRDQEMSASEAAVFAQMSAAMDVVSTCFGGEVRGQIGEQDERAGGVAFVYDKRQRARVYWYEF